MKTYDECTWQERRDIRNACVKQQKNICIHCGTFLDGKACNTVLAKKVNPRLFPPNFFHWPVHLHHDHETGRIIGAVHCYCNAVLWQYHKE